MLTSTFIHVSGIGAVTEQSLWQQGALTWEDYQERSADLKVPPKYRYNLDKTVAESLDALAQGRADYFAAALAGRDHWRALSHFPKIGFLDIETDGGMDPDGLTIIGLSDGFETKIYTKGRDLARFAYECQEFDGFVTFFGGGFDIPFLKRRFPVLNSVFAERLHVDLCPLLGTLGYRGGLKSIEHQLGINRRPETDGLSGLDAVRLWQTYRSGGPHAEEALRLLHEYNEEDVINMKALLVFALPKIREKTGHPGFETPWTAAALHPPRHNP